MITVSIALITVITELITVITVVTVVITVITVLITVITELCCNRPPRAGTFRQVQQVQARLGLGLQGQRQAELELGGQGVLGRLPDHSLLALLKNVNFRCRPTTTPFRNMYIYIKPPLSRRPHEKQKLGGGDILFVRYGSFGREFTIHTVAYGIYINIIYTVLANPNHNSQWHAGILAGIALHIQYSY